MVSRGIGIGMELPGPRAVSACGNVDATKSKISARLYVTPPGGVGQSAA